MYILLKSLIFLFSRLPLRVLQYTASLVGLFAWYILRSRRKVAVTNACIVGAKNPWHTAKESFKNTFMSYFETAYIHNINKDFVKKYVTVEGMENFRNLHDNGKKFVLVSAHIGSWDLIAAITAIICNVRFMIVGRESENKALNKILEEQRNDSNVVYMGHVGYLENIGKYEELGYYTGSLLDHSSTASESVIAPFFGLRVRTLAGLPAVCARKKLPMLCCYLLRRSGGFTLIFHPPVYPDAKLKPKERIIQLCTDMNKDFETIIRRAPEQWYLLHKRFKKVEEADGAISERIYR